MLSKKRMLALVCALVLVFPAALSSADTYENQILFRGFSWDTTYAEFSESFPDGQVASIGTHVLGYGFESRMRNGERIKCGDIGFYFQRKNPNIKAAGYSILYLSASFIYPTAEDGTLLREKERARLMEADYEISVFGQEEQDKAVQDLQQKLTRLYGDCDFSNLTGSDLYWAWYGAEGTVVTLVDRGSTSNGYSFIEIRYSYEGAKDLIEQAQAADRYAFSLITEGL